jgi:hypothetical protein
MRAVSLKTLALVSPLLLLAACQQEEVTVEPAMQEGDGAGELVAEPAEGVEVNVPETPMTEVVVDPSASPSAAASPAAE